MRALEQKDSTWGPWISMVIINEMPPQFATDTLDLSSRPALDMLTFPTR